MTNLVCVSDSYVIERATNLVSADTINKLNEFYRKTNLLENDYKQYALKLIEAALKVNHSGDTKKYLTTLLLDLGFKNASVSKMIGAQEFINQLESRESQAAPWVKTLPISTTYQLGTLDTDTFARAWEKSDFGEKTIKRDDVIDLKLKHMKPKFSPEKNQPSNLEQALKLVKDYPHLANAIQAELDKQD